MVSNGKRAGCNLTNLALLAVLLKINTMGHFSGVFLDFPPVCLPASLQVLLKVRNSVLED
jgi:hypothetical protein